MSVTCSGSFPDLLCGEDSGIFTGESSPACSSSDLESSASIEESIAGFIEDERNFVPGFDYLTRFQTQSLDASAREESVAWILKVMTLMPPYQYTYINTYVQPSAKYLMIIKGNCQSI